jgi:hypothetical protein
MTHKQSRRGNTGSDRILAHVQLTTRYLTESRLLSPMATCTQPPEGGSSENRSGS